MTKSTMKEISTIQEAEAYIFNYDFFSNLDQKKDALFPLLSSCEQLAIQFNRDNLLCRTRTFLIYLHIEENRLGPASELAVINLQMAREKGLDDELLYMIAIIAHLYQLTGDYSASEELIQIALNSIHVIRDDNKICRIYLMIASQYFFTNEKHKCLEAFEKSIQYALKTDNASLIAICYNNYADKLISYGETADFFKIIEAGNKYALASKNKSIIYQLNDKYGYYYSQQKDYKRAASCLARSIRYHTANNNISQANEVKLDLINLCIENRKFSKARALLGELELSAQESKANKQLLQLYNLYTKYFAHKRDYENAFNYLKLYNQVNAVIHNEESDEKIKNLQIQYHVKTIQSERDNAQKMARIKHDFLSNMSHEIRTPINNILGISYLLRQDSLSDKQLDYLTRLNQSGEQLLHIINDILDISKIEAGKFQLVTGSFSPKELTENIYRQFTAKASEKHISLTMTTDDRLPPTCIGDVTRISQVLNNMLSNAIKFTPQGSVHLATDVSSVSGNQVWLRFTIQDTGIGMTAAQMKNIFHEYEQAESSTQIKFGGTGLGLSITKKLIELMNGKIDVASQAGTGTTFTISIPLLIAEEIIPAAGDTKNISCEALSGKMIYIADDLEENRKVMSELLHVLNPGIRIKLAENGKQLLELVDQQLPDIILLDLDMPVLNGFETVEILRKDKRSVKFRIIACTASLLTMNKEELITAGFNNLLQKPFTISQLAEILS
jgi:signal transduction histidine kinase